MVIESDTAIFLTTKRIYFIKEKSDFPDLSVQRSGSSSGDSTTILWQEVLFPDSRFVVVSSVVSLFSRLSEVIGLNLDEIHQFDEHLFSQIVALRDTDQDASPFNVPKHLQISDWKMQLEIARQINHERHPRENMRAFSEILETVNTDFKEKTENGLGGADELLPIISYIACKSKIRRPSLCIKLIKVICTDEMQGIGGYAVTTFESVFNTLGTHPIG